MEINNKRIQYTVNHSNDNNSLVGEVITVGKEILSFSGNIYNLNNENISDFYYSEDKDGIITRNLSGLKRNTIKEINTILDEAIEGLKENLNNYGNN